MLIQRPYRLLSDLVVNEVDPAVGYARKVVPVTVATDTTLSLGAVVFRAKGTDPTVPFAPVLAAADIATTNEYAVLIGTHYGYQLADVKLLAADSPTEVTTYRRGMVILKKFKIKEAVVALFAGITDAQFDSLCHLLEEQGVLTATSGTVVKPVI